ncbi:MAG: hypothetical protein WBO82_02845 [Neisseria sp.]
MKQQLPKNKINEQADKKKTYSEKYNDLLNRFSVTDQKEITDTSLID